MPDEGPQSTVPSGEGAAPKASALVEQLRTDMARRWQAGDPVRVEAYLDGHPELRADLEGLRDLVYQEALLREQRGETPRPEEYRQRFPEVGPHLGKLFEAHRALER